MLELHDGPKAGFSHPALGIGHAVATAPFGVDQDVHCKSRGPSRAGSRFIKKTVLNDQAATGIEMDKGFFHERRIGIRVLVMQDVRHQRHVIGPT